MVSSYWLLMRGVGRDSDGIIVLVCLAMKIRPLEQEH